MSQEKFVSLINDFCQLSGLGQPDRVIAGQLFMISEVNFTLVHSEAANTTLLSIYADFGELPPHLALEICKVLLEANLYLCIEKGPIFSLSPDHQRVICADQRLLDNLTPQSLLDQLLLLAEKAAEWRLTYFLQAPQRQVTARARPKNWVPTASRTGPATVARAG